MSQFSKKIGLSFSFFLLLVSCAQERIQIGRENPNQEMEKCVRLSSKKHYEKAVECLEIFKSRFPQTEEGQLATLKIADSYFAQGQYLLAADSYQYFIKTYPFHPQVDYALYKAGLSFVREAPKSIDRDQQNLIKAKEQLIEAVRFSKGTYHDLALFELKQVEDRLAKRIFYIGHFYYRTEEYKAAIPRFAELIQNYPKSPLAEKTLYYLALAHLKTNQVEEARQAVELLTLQFPKSRWTNKARNRYIRVATKKEP